MASQTRRSFMKSGLSMISLISLGLPAFSQNGKGNSRQVLPTWESLLSYARWAPSVHNLQPHKLKVISADTAHLYYDPKRLLPVGDPNSVFATVAMGIFIEYLSIAASPFGQKVVVESLHNSIDESGSELSLFATLKLARATKKESLDRSLIFDRRTSRQVYDGRVIDDECLKDMVSTSHLAGQDCRYTSKSEDIAFIVDLNQKALFHDLEDAPNREELNQLFRYNKNEAFKHKDGLWATCMGFPGWLVKSVFQNHEKWVSGWRKKMLSKFYRSSFDGTSTVAWLSGPFETREDRLQAGHALARLWLTITKHGAYIQPFGSLITNPNANAGLQNYFKTDADANTIWLIFRVGYSDQPTRSFRLDIEDILI
jgi:hypothetical protein